MYLYKSSSHHLGERNRNTVCQDIYRILPILPDSEEKVSRLDTSRYVAEPCGF